MAAIPCDNQIRAMLDPVDPALFFPVFTDVMGARERSGGLAEFRRLQGRVLIALDGTEYFRSTSGSLATSAFIHPIDLSYYFGDRMADLVASDPLVPAC